VNYIDAGYGIALTVLSAYSVQLWFRRRRLERLAAQVDAADALDAQLEVTLPVEHETPVEV
jgi:hypothetical protein